MTETGHSLLEIVSAVKGQLLQQSGNAQPVTELLTDSRRLASAEGCMFIALKSKRNDGHRYIEDLYSRGVRNFIVEQAPENLEQLPEASFILVKNSLHALQMLAASHRKKFNIQVIGITGSNGKTIVKEWLYQLMYEDKNIVRSPKSFNSQIGVPLSVWQMNENHDLAIFEAGVSEPDEMDRLQPIIYPTIGIFTNLGHAHDENFINRHQKAGEKLKLFTKVEMLIYCLDQKELQEGILKSGILKNIRTFTWSRNEKADLSIKSVVHAQHTTTISGLFRSQFLEISIPFTDEASVENAIHCWAAMLLLDYPHEVISRRMKLLQPVAMRLEMKEGINNCTIINDTYNSDIDSLAIALDFLNQQKQHRKKTVILSDILQSGRSDNYLYQEIAQLLESKSVDQIIGIGKSISKQSGSFKMNKSFFQNTEEFLNKFPLASFSNETILLKGARIFQFEQISDLLQQKTHETVLEINLNALVHNLNHYRSLLSPGVKMMAMVKAFSYGSGSFEIANLLQFHHVDYLTVAYADEGVELRKAGINLPVMVMNPDQESFDSMLKHNLEPEIYSFRILRLLEDSLSRLSGQTSIGIHIKIDTGMKRLGFDPSEVDELVLHLRNNPQLKVISVFSHLAGTDNPALDEFTQHQVEVFREACSKICGAFDYPILRHILNTAGISRFRDAQFDMVRLGIGLYGISPTPDEQSALLNVSTLKSSISQVKVLKQDETLGYNRAWKASEETTIGIVPIGYADGLSRRLSNGRGHMMVNGKVVPVIGNVCMDMCFIDITGVQAREGDEVLIFGKEMPITRLAEEMDTIPYEILTGISRRVKRVYFEE